MLFVFGCRLKEFCGCSRKKHRWHFLPRCILSFFYFFCIFPVGFFLTSLSILVSQPMWSACKEGSTGWCNAGLTVFIPIPAELPHFRMAQLVCPNPQRIYMCAAVEYRRAHHCHTAASVHILLWVKSSVTMSVSNSLASFHVPSFFFHFCFS